ncbi:MAG: acylglycerol kinase family protein [Proteobacteria bacterium]|nr:acylglycerol kinase family protein [Pseudomonadota bacterium]
MSRCVVDELRGTIADGDLFTTKNVDEGNCAWAEILQCNYRLVFCGGGDGTAMHAMNQISCSHNRPALGILPLGTGNGWAVEMQMPPRAQAVAL